MARDLNPKNLGHPSETLIPWPALQRLEAGYRSNPYHNGTHAADVVQALGALLLGEPGFRDALSALELLAMVLAAAAHDVGHPGAGRGRILGFDG